ncbi:uncharacterized protein Z518_09000 [Rhinocladiella mackenziei CBS 650.93]|uniref:NACHT domain-containing protein n=1 Tax=Rhinocladiella mackenziei CBS 650.93 TaxID=1442369 RepID=A0A0D2IXE6_9EURO|nr:uncharacterized protein Z518_09000 [Rhinocladiella mackenziei CBS 650.93]KIX01275.1 hypothetical protein Z518_09000 [Rhinocladiella mackenziei CBS 650.93]
MLRIRSQLNPISSKENYQHHKEGIVPGTFEWFLKTPEFMNWVSSSGSSLLMVQGRPGCGKSALSSIIFDRLCEIRPPGGQVFLFFGGPTCPITACIRSLMFWLLENVGLDISSLDNLSKSGVGSASSVKVLFEAIRQPLYQMVAAISPLFCIIDGVDECTAHERERLHLLDELEKLVKATPTIKVFVTCRVDEFVSPANIPSDWTVVNIRPSDVSPDIRKVTETWVTASPDLNANATNITERLVQNSQGTFLWVKLMMEELKGCGPGPNEADRILRSLPRALSERYHQLIQRRYDSLNSNQWERFAKTLWWLALAPRPLTVDEILAARPVMSGASFQDDEGNYDKDGEIRRLREDCGALATIHQDGTVELVHKSFADFLIREQGTPSSSSGVGSICRDVCDVHYELSSICLDYLLHGIDEQGWQAARENTDPSRYGLLKYASQFWVHHVCLSGTPGLRQDLVKKVATFLGTWPGKEWFLAYKRSVGSSWLGSMQVDQHRLTTWLSSGSQYSGYHVSSDIGNFVLSIARRSAAEVEDNSSSSEPSIEKLYTAGFVCLKQGLLDEAEKWLNRALDMSKAAHGFDSNMSLNILKEMADLREQQARLEDAETLLEQVLAIERDMYDGKRISADILETMNQLGFIYQEQGKLRLAEERHLITLLMCEEELGDKSLTALRTKNHLAIVARNQGNLQKAEDLHKKVLKDREDILGKDHPAVLQVVNHLAIVHRKQHKFEEANEEYRRALVGREHTLGPDHPTTLNTAYSIGVLCEQQNRFDEARMWYRRVLTGRRKKLGTKHPKTVEVTQTLKSLRRRLHFHLMVQDVAEQCWWILLAYILRLWRFLFRRSRGDRPLHS